MSETLTYHSKEDLPFINVNDRRVITDEQAESEPALGEFIKNHSEEFYRDEAAQMFVLRERLNSPGYGRVWGAS